VLLLHLARGVKFRRSKFAVAKLDAGEACIGRSEMSEGGLEENCGVVVRASLRQCGGSATIDKACYKQRKCCNCIVNRLYSPRSRRRSGASFPVEGGVCLVRTARVLDSHSVSKMCGRTEDYIAGRVSVMEEDRLDRFQKINA
jgi:hypothetical protein